MSLKSLSTGVQVTLTEPLVDKNSDQRKAIMAYPELAALMPRVDEAHGGLIATQPKPVTASITALAEQALKLDTTHDSILRSAFGVLTAFAQAASTPEEAQSILQLRDELFPDGLQMINRSLREEAGATRLLEQRLTREMRSALQKLPLPGKRTVADLVDELIAVGKQMGALEDRRAAEQVPATGLAPADVVRARNKWIRSVNALVSMAELVEMPADTYQLVFGPMRAAEKAAEQRRQRRGGSPAEPNVTDPNPGASPHNP